MRDIAIELTSKDWELILLWLNEHSAPMDDEPVDVSRAVGKLRSEIEVWLDFWSEEPHPTGVLCRDCVHWNPLEEVGLHLHCDVYTANPVVEDYSKDRAENRQRGIASGPFRCPGYYKQSNEGEEKE